MKPGMPRRDRHLLAALLGAALMLVPSVVLACECKGMTWVYKGHTFEANLVGADNFTQPYTGDTSCATSLPILCLRKEGLPRPLYLLFDFSNGWAGGHIRLTPPHAGNALSSRAAADRLCAQAFGAGWVMAEYHDGNLGNAWHAYGSLNHSGRFWVAINDQRANPWDCPAPKAGFHGVVTAGNNVPIAGATVDADNGHVATTDASGRYTLPGLPLGTYTLRTRMPGWTFGSPDYQNTYLTRTLTQTGQSLEVNITGWEFEPVVFVHGWTSNSADFGSTPDALKAKGYYTYAGQLETRWDSTPPFETNALRVKDWIAQAKYVTGRKKVILYGYSMGGLVARAYLESGLYQGDVSRIFTYGSPHLGTPFIPLQGELCFATQSSDAVCQMSPAGMEQFNRTHFRRSGVAYHLIAGDAPMWKTERKCFRIRHRTLCPPVFPLPDLTFRNPEGWVTGAVIPGADDGLIKTCSAAGLPGSMIDRYITREVHTTALGDRDYHHWNGGPSQEGFGECSKRILIDQKAVACGSLRGLGPLGCAVINPPGLQASSEQASPPALAQRSRMEEGRLHAGERRVRQVLIEGGATAFSASWKQGKVHLTLIDPTGKVIDPAHAASIQGDPDAPGAEEVAELDPDIVVYSASPTSAAYHFPAARPGTWQLVLQADTAVPAEGTSFTSAASFDSPLVARFSSDRSSYAPGSAAQLSVRFSQPVQAAEFLVTVRLTGGASESVWLQQTSATEYTGHYWIPQASGYAAFDWSVTGQRLDGAVFERGGRELFQIHSTRVRLGRAHTDRAIPREDVPGLNSALAVTLEVQSDGGDGKLGVFAELVAADGSVVARTVVSAPATVGVNHVELRFRAEEIYQSKADGPYTLRNVQLLDERHAPLLSQEIALAHTTGAYSYLRFAPTQGTPAVFLDGPFRLHAGETLQLKATGIDPEGEAVRYAWDLDADGSFELSGQSVPFTASTQAPAGLRTIRVRVVDPAGNMAVGEAQVEVLPVSTNQPPVARCRDVEVPADPMCWATDSVDDGSYDPDMGDTFECVQTSGEPDLAGARRVTLTCRDAAGLSSSCEATVTVAEWQPLTLMLDGDREMTLECGVDTWSDPGARAWDACGPVEVHRSASGQEPSGPGPNVHAEGTYLVQYSAWNATQWVSDLRAVHVDDRTAPELRLKGPSSMTHPCGSAWVDPGVEATDACSGDVSASVVRAGDSVNGWVPGVYTVRYLLTDSGGNSAPPVTRTVEVVGCSG